MTSRGAPVTAPQVTADDRGTEIARLRGDDLAAGKTGELVHERQQARRVLEHEDVELDSRPRQPGPLPQGGVDRARHRGPVEYRLPVALQVRGRLPVEDHDGLLDGARIGRQKAP